MIEDILVLEEQDFNPSLVVVAVSGWEEPVGGPKRPLQRLVTRGGQGVPNGGLRQPGKALW